MVHTLTKKNEWIEIKGSSESVLLSFNDEHEHIDIELSKEELHDFIGILLHLQSKLKK